MEVLELKPLKNKEVCVYLTKNSDKSFEFLKNVPLSFSTVDLEEDFEKFEKTSLGKLLRILNVPLYRVDMPQNAKDYLYEDISQLDEQISELLEALDKLKDKDSHKAENIKCWVDSLTEELKEKKKSIELKVRPQWIVKKVLDLIKKSDDPKLSLIHVTRDETFGEILSQLRKLGVEVIVYEDNIIHLIPAKIVAQGGIDQWKY